MGGLRGGVASDRLETATGSHMTESSRKKTRREAGGDMSKPYDQRYSPALPRAKVDRAATFRDLLMEGCSGLQRIDRSLYRTLRKELMQPKTKSLLPDFVRNAEEAETFCRLIEARAAEVGGRRKIVWDSFVDLIEVLGRGRPRPSDPLTDAEKYSLTPEFDRHEMAATVSASAWTGRRTMHEHRLVVMQLAPVAIESLEVLIREQEKRLHNYPPDLINEAPLDALRQLHKALGQLLYSADRLQALQSSTITARRWLERAFDVAKDTGELLVGGLPTLTASTITGWGTFALCQWIVGLDPATSGTIGAAAVGATLVEASKKPASDTSKRGKDK